MEKVVIFISLYILHSFSYILPSNVPTTIVGDAEFNITNSPYFISANTVVDTTNSLVIDPGVIIYFAYQTSLQIRGTLIANGTASNPITFTAQNTALPWATLQLISSTAIINNCIFSYGGSGAGTNGMLYVIHKLFHIFRYLFADRINPTNWYILPIG